jgi:chaperonin GroES
MFKPLHDKVVVKRIDALNKTASGIIIPESAQERPQQGYVMAVGPGARSTQGDLVPMGVVKGDKILFGKYTGSEIKVDGEMVIIMKESDIFGVLTEEATPKLSVVKKK